MNSFPTIGKEAMRDALSKSTGVLTWQPMGGDLSHSGDLGYTYGATEFKKQGTEGASIETGSYMRVWRKMPDGSWKVVLDMVIPA
jgi:ketosteroid isomerase-like protein